jgi:hypothetical protein
MKMKLVSILATTLAILSAVALAGCAGQTGPTASTAGNVNFRLLLSDEPNEINNFYSLNVTINSIGWEKEGESDNWTVDPPKSVDLTKLVGDNATEIWNGHLTSGNYTKVFIYTENVEGILKGSDGTSPGDNATVKLPSGKLQISKPFTISEEDGSSIVNFVFDITVVKAGNSGQYILKPQIAESGANQPFNDVTPAGEKREGVKIATTSLLDGSVGSFYNVTLTAVGGTLPYSWNLQGGNLPDGLSLSPTGVISGTPGAGTAGSYSFTVKVSDNSTPVKSDTEHFSIRITGG